MKGIKTQTFKDSMKIWLPGRVRNMAMRPKKGPQSNPSSWVALMLREFRFRWYHTPWRCAPRILQNKRRPQVSTERKLGSTPTSHTHTHTHTHKRVYMIYIIKDYILYQKNIPNIHNIDYMQKIAPCTPFISNGTKIEGKRLNDQTLQGAVSLDSTTLPAPLQHCPMDNA